MCASFRKNSGTPTLPNELVKGAGSRTGVRSSFNGRFVPQSEVKQDPRETVAERLKSTKKTK